MHTLSESKSIFAIEQKATVSCFVKTVAFLLGHPVLLISLLERGTKQDNPLPAHLFILASRSCTE